MERELKRRNELEALEIVREFHDDELSKVEPDEFLVWLCARLIRLVEERHKAEAQQQ